VDRIVRGASPPLVPLPYVPGARPPPFAQKLAVPPASGTQATLLPPKTLAQILSGSSGSDGSCRQCRRYACHRQRAKKQPKTSKPGKDMTPEEHRIDSTKCAGRRKAVRICQQAARLDEERRQETKRYLSRKAWPTPRSWLAKPTYM
jgi:hypothetical protein